MGNAVCNRIGSALGGGGDINCGLVGWCGVSCSVCIIELVMRVVVR